MTEVKAAKDGNVYVPFEDRKGNESIVYFTRDISPAGIKKAYEKVNQHIKGKVAVKLHTGEQHGPNFTPAAWVKEVMETSESLKNATIIETNTYYEGDRDTTESTARPWKSTAGLSARWTSPMRKAQRIYRSKAASGLIT